MLPIIKNQSEWWKNRCIDWRKQYFVPHPHQQLIVSRLHKMIIGSVAEVGCGAGKNIYLIKRMFPNIEVGGTDINEEAIETARQIFEENNQQAAILETCPAHDLFMNDKSVDMILTDACLLYVGNINRTIREFKRVARKSVMFVELHSEDWRERIKLRWQKGYRAHDYKSLLRKHGFYDIVIEKIPEALWPGEPWSSFGFVITAKL